MAEAHRVGCAQDDRAGSGLSGSAIEAVTADRPIEAMTADRPIGVFDSGIGGFSVLNALQAELPDERFVYFSTIKSVGGAAGCQNERSEEAPSTPYGRSKRAAVRRIGSVQTKAIRQSGDGPAL